MEVIKNYIFPLEDITDILLPSKMAYTPPPPPKKKGTQFCDLPSNEHHIWALLTN